MLAKFISIRAESILVRFYICFAEIEAAQFLEWVLETSFDDKRMAEKLESHFRESVLPASLVKDHLQREEVYRLSGIATFSAVCWLIVGGPSCLLLLAPPQRLWHKLPGNEKLPDQAKEFSTLTNNVLMGVCARPARDGTRPNSTSVQFCTWHLYKTPTRPQKLKCVSDAAGVFWYAYRHATNY